MSRLKMVSASCLSFIITASLLVSGPSHADDNLKPISVEPSETVASFITHLFPATEFATGATLMALKSIPVVGAFAHDAGVYLLLASAFDEGTDIAAMTSRATGANAALGHAGSATALFLAGQWIHRSPGLHKVAGKWIQQEAVPVTPTDFNSIFVRAATTNEISASLKATISDNASSASSNTAWNPPLQLLLANLGVVLATGPLLGGSLKEPGFISGLHKASIITASYRAADFANVAVQSTLGTPVTATKIFAGVTLATTGWALIHKQPDYTLGLVADNLVESSLLGIMLPMTEQINAASAYYFPSYPKTTATVASTALVAGMWAYARNHPENRFARQAESGVRLGYVLFTVAPLLKTALTEGCVAVAERFGETPSSAYTNARDSFNTLGARTKNSDEL